MKAKADTDIIRELPLSKWGELQLEMCMAVKPGHPMERGADGRPVFYVRAVGWVERKPTELRGRHTGRSAGATAFLTIMPARSDDPRALRLGKHRQINVAPILADFGIPRKYLKAHQGDPATLLVFERDGDSGRWMADLTDLMEATKLLRDVHRKSAVGPLFQGSD